ncbi:MAG: prolyl oligopeptidase family serine peptidase [Phycisphaeraceae bacterium]|nr:prolyl oligopeptidase family serine peptidase [Phycisphaeraceae bacterium]
MPATPPNQAPRPALTTPRTARLVACALALLLCTSASPAADPDRVFDMPGGPPRSVVVGLDATPPDAEALDSPMLRALAGIIGQVTPREFAQLRRMARTAEAPESLEGATLVGVMHLASPAARKRVEILRLPDGTLIASEIDPIDPSGVASAAVMPDAFDQIVAQWSRYAAGFNPPDIPTGRVVDLEHPYLPSPVTFDEQTLGDRFWGGQRWRLRPAARDLDVETIYLRLPEAYTPTRPAGLLVWIDPSESGRPPAFAEAAGDALNLAVVGVSNAGNNRNIADRHQLIFDAIANATSRVHIDPQRVYVFGVSGGGRVSSMHWGCFPDVYAGAICIVGVNAYENIALGNGSFMPQGYALPRGEARRLREHRLAAMTGPRDFNHAQIARTLDAMRSDGFDVRLLEYPDMGHEYPTAARFREALEWVDQPWQARTAEQTQRAQTMLDGWRSRYADSGPPDPLPDRDREVLIRVTREAPWSAPAWEAARLLGFAPPEPNLAP